MEGGEKSAVAFLDEEWRPHVQGGIFLQILLWHSTKLFLKPSS